MIKVLVLIVIYDMAMPMALLTVIMVAVVTIILPSPTASGILNRSDRTTIMVMTLGIDACVAFVSIFRTVLVLQR